MINKTCLLWIGGKKDNTVHPTTKRQTEKSNKCICASNLERIQTISHFSYSHVIMTDAIET